MKKQKIDFLRSKRRVQVGVLDLVLSYLSLIFIVGVPWLVFIVPFVHQVLNGKVPSSLFTCISLLLTIVVVFILLSINKSFKLTEIGNYADADVHEDVKLCFEELNWNYEKLSELEYVASTPISWFSWGEIVYLALVDDLVLMNSRGSVSSITFGKDKRNLNKFKKAFMRRVKSRR
ncbi:hypothetical protein [Halocola ammonii]